MPRSGLLIMPQPIRIRPRRGQPEKIKAAPGLCPDYRFLASLRDFELVLSQ